MAGDERISEVLNAFSKHYRDKYQVPYMISYGRDSKIAQRILAYTDSFMDKEASVPHLLETMKNYFSDTSKIVVDSKHSFSIFAHAPHKWMAKEEEKKEEKKPEPLRTYADIHEWLPTLEPVQKEAYFKSWVRNSSWHRSSNPKLYHETRQTFLKELGKERCVQLWLQQSQSLQEKNASESPFPS